MGIFSKKVYQKDKNGEWKLVSEGVERISHSEKFWQRSNKQEKKSGFNEHTYLSYQNGEKDNRVVVFATTYFPDGVKVERKLLTTSNKVPKKTK